MGWFSRKPPAPAEERIITSIVGGGIERPGATLGNFLQVFGMADLHLLDAGVRVTPHASWLRRPSAQLCQFYGGRWPLTRDGASTGAQGLTTRGTRSVVSVANIRR